MASKITSSAESGVANHDSRLDNRIDQSVDANYSDRSAAIKGDDVTTTEMTPISAPISDALDTKKNINEESENLDESNESDSGAQSITRPRKRSSNTKSLTSGNVPNGTTFNKIVPAGDNPASLRSQFVVVLVLVSLNNTFERKSLFLPFGPEVLRLGRQTNSKTLPNPDNGFFDSRVLSRQHAEIWVDRNARAVMIKDAKSSNGTYVNNKRLSPDNTESAPCELKRGDVLELGIDIHSDDGANLLHKKIAAKVDRISIVSLQGNSPVNNNTPITDSNGNIIPGGNNNVISSSTLPQSIPPPSSPSLLNNTLNSGGFMSRLQPRRSKIDTLDVALFGDVDTTLEDLSALHIRHTMGGLFMKSGITNSTAVENAVKQISQEIYATKLGTAKLKSIQKVMQKVLETQHSNKEIEAQRQIYEQKSANQVIEIRGELSHAKSALKEKDNSIASLKVELQEYREKTSVTDTQLSVLAEDLNRTKNQLESEIKRAVTTEKELEIERQKVDELENIIKSKEDDELSKSIEEERIQRERAEHSLHKLSQWNSTRFDALPFNTGFDVFSSVFNASAIPLLSALGVTILGIGIMSLINAYNRDR
ncbi:hypothetical protein NADFUDRAFT_49448 [Nadsonia fulvescens var. elongata DSM 6958]|uniref:FHA domain-containing protein n=1 Tax=Nadsonia fulvescens var. elongata DSM 6958 TaxID=857566 RepID=A0A1E3PNK0_9ASCO|nr:hypothetical protein NADFUDRAFT_49448 [Nadsonia fulvescens var. elongata DSM 6958]